MMLRKLLASLLLAVTLSGCGIMPLKPGSATFVRPDGSSLTVKQPQNPKDASTQKYTRTEEQGKVTEVIETKIGASQKDTAREAMAKLGALRPVMWVGIMVFLFGAASAFHPMLKALVGGSVTTSAVIAAAGLLMIVLPTLLVGNEILILAGCGGAAAFYFFAIRHGHARGEAKVLREMIDLNKNGIDDREETK